MNQEGSNEKQNRALSGSELKIGVSSCLLGNEVRFDGGHKHDRYITGTLGNYITFVPVCPEVECGLPIPREAMRLDGRPADPKTRHQQDGGGPHRTHDQLGEKKGRSARSEDRSAVSSSRTARRLPGWSA